MARGDDRRRLRLRLRSVTAVAAALVLVPGLTPDPVAPAEAVAGPDVVLLGDSVTEQAFGYLGGATRGAPSPAHLERWSHTGWTLADAARHAGAAVSSASTGVLVLAVGPNDAASWDGGWTDADVARWQAVLDGVPAATCVAVVLPGWGAPLDGTPWERNMQQMRTDVSRLVAARHAAGSPTFTVDWLPVVTRHPDYLAADGIHLATEAAATARQSLYWSAVDRCRS